eukprot:TRINITY_DN3880_c0_g1_i1.p1 TRINITY_DN3880_c0_g1~~TRINITY_DN3880_c0_g1_i1.p1  ORF type:complete len:263 (-),score=48.66 TRINITY_DN3880_c0_g1_i1:105-788(-)
MRHNVLPAVEALFPRRQGIYKIYDRDFNKPDPHAANEWDTVRDMQRIWKDTQEFGPRNTILLDNESRKFQDTPRNGLVVPEFGVDEVRARTKTTLDTLLAYLTAMANSPDFNKPEFDVRDYMDNVPYDPSMSMKELQAELEKIPKQGKSGLDRCLDLHDLGGRSVSITEVQDDRIMYSAAFSEPKINIIVTCKKGLTFTAKMQVALILKSRVDTHMELLLDDEVQPW